MTIKKDKKESLQIQKFEVARFENSSKIMGGDDHTVLDQATTRCCKTKK